MILAGSMGQVSSYFLTWVEQQLSEKQRHKDFLKALGTVTK